MPGAWLDDKAATERGAEFFIEPGPYPSGGWIHLPNSEALELKFKKGGHTLKMTDDGGKTIQIKPVYISSREDAGPGITKLNLVDLRYFWKYQKITAQYNLLNDDKKTFNVKTTPGGVVTIGYTFKEIVNKLLDVLKNVPSGITNPGTDIPGGLLDGIDTSSVPMLVDVKWEYVPAGEALSGILQLFGGTLSISTGGDIVVAMPGEDEWTKKASNLKDKTVSGASKNDTTAAVKKPLQLKVQYRVLREKLFKKKYWEAVMAHDGLGANGQEKDGTTPGEWLPVNDVLKDWGWSEDKIKKLYYNKDALLDGANEHQVRHWNHVRAQFYKFFRYTQPGSGNTETRAQVLPFHDEAGTYMEPVSGEAMHGRPYPVDCVMSLDTGTAGPQTLIKAKVPIDLVTIEDERLGIIRFNTREPVAEAKLIGRSSGWGSWSYTLITPDIQVVIPFVKKFQSATNLADDYYTSGGDDGYADSWTGLPSNGYTETLLDDSQYYVERDLTATGSYTAFNEDDIDKRAKKYAEDYYKAFEVELKDKPYDIVVGAYEPGIKRLDGKLRYMQFMANDAGGFTAIYRVNSNKPLNPHSRNFVESYGGLQRQGETIQTTGPHFMKQPGRGSGNRLKVGDNYAGVRERGESVDFRPGSMFLDRHPVFINPAYVGVGVAQDINFSGKGKKTGAVKKGKTTKTTITVGDVSGGGGGGKVDRRTMVGRVTGEKDGIPDLELVAKTDITPNYGSGNWECVIIAPSSKGKEKAKDPDKGGPQETGAGTQSGYKPSFHVDDAGKMHPGPGPATGGTPSKTSSRGGTKPGQAPAAKTGGADSTFIWLAPPEGTTTKKGAVRDVLRVCEHRTKGTDPDGHTIDTLGVENATLFHKDDSLCGPLHDIGRKIQPPPVGIPIWVDRIFDPRYNDWRWMGRVPFG